jgi:hypothetical protein
MQYRCFSFNVYVQRETITDSLFLKITVSPPPHTPRITSPPRVATVYNKHTGGGGDGVSPSEHMAYLAPASCIFGLLSIVFSGIFCHPQLDF